MLSRFNGRGVRLWHSVVVLPFSNIKVKFKKSEFSSAAVKMSSYAKIKVKQGTIIGCNGLLPNGKPYQCFRGIPYAVPPVGELRFEAPIPLKKFATPEIDCTKEGDAPLQGHLSKPKIVGSEDCLFLNVYAPTSKRDTPLPVMVFLHGGRFRFGDGNGYLYTPLYLIQEDVIVITLNYRLEALGLLSLPEAQVPGNMGLKDQLLVLKWVQENIAEFNGDPNNVTLFGESSGAVCVHMHLYSKNSRKLFHKAIVQSGSSIVSWALQERASIKAIELAKILGCPSVDPVEVIKFLKSYKDPHDFIKHYPKVLNADEIRRGKSIALQPVVEEDSPDAIITEEPIKAMNKPNAINIPVMMGYNSAEGIVSIRESKENLDRIENDLSRYVPRDVNLHPDDPKCLEIGKKIRDLYFKGGKVDETNLDSLVDVIGDNTFTMGCHFAAEIHAKKQHNSPLYFYRFDYNGGLNKYKQLFGMSHLKGVCHADELFYLFQSNLAKEPWDDKDRIMVKRMCKLWTNFAKYGNPTPDKNDRFVDCTWEPVRKVHGNEKYNLNAFIIDEKQRMEDNPDGERMDFWRNIYRTFNTTPSKL